MDATVISEITETELSKFIPKFGDCIAIINFCKRTANQTVKKQGLLEKLRSKIAGGNAELIPNSSKVEPSKKKSTRTIEFGWLHHYKNGKLKGKCMQV